MSLEESQQQPAVNVEPEAGAANPPPAAALTGIQKRLRTITPEQERLSQRRATLVGREVDRRGAGTRRAPDIPVALRVDRALAAYDNGINVKGWRVRAYNGVSGEWKVGEITHVSKHKPRGQGRDPNAASYVIAIVKHEDAQLLDRAYEVSCLERVQE